MKTLFADQLTPDTGTLTDYFLVAQADRKNKKDGKLYFSLKLQDRTGVVVGKLWDVPDDLTDLKAGDFVKVEGSTQSYRDELQLNVKRIRRATREEVALEDFIPASKRDRGELFQEVLSMVDNIAHIELHLTVRRMLYDHETELKDCPAAKNLHQAYLGGLMEHILGIGRAAMAVCTVYTDLDRDLLIAAAVLHDLGKMQELNWYTAISYSPVGSLVGHVTLGNMLFDKYSGALDPATRLHMMHLIASHHGQLSWGAARMPMTKEALVFHSLDMLDARLQVIQNAVAAGVDANGFTPFVPAMETRLWNGKAGNDVENNATS